MKQLVPVLLFLTPACSEYELNGHKPELASTKPIIEVTPEEINFGDVVPGETETGFFLVKNVGDEVLHLGDLFVTNGVFALQTTASGMELMPGDDIDGMVSYTALEDPQVGKVVVPSDDPDHPEVDIRLIGGVGEVPPDLPDPPEPPVAQCAVVPPIVEAMTETADLIGDQSYDPNGQSLTYTWTGIARPTGSNAVIPGPTSSTDPNRLGFAPDVAGTYGFELVVTNEDGLRSPPCNVELEATQPPIDKPIAVCSVSPPITEAIHGDFDLIGDQSYDPAGLALTTYTWRLVGAPPGSSVPTAPSATANPNRLGLIPDVVGIYNFELVVTNSAGLDSDPCFTAGEAIPAEDLWIEMFWAHNDDDMDLHVTRNGAALRDFSYDCYFSNCTGASGLDWGPAGGAGNPRLDLDDIPGTGPENINITQPENTTYNVWVHDYVGTGPWSGNNDVTVNVYMSGVLAWTDTRNLSGEGAEEHFCDVDWAGQTVIPR